MDLSNLSSVKSAAADFLARSDKLNVLINNAGLSLCEETMTVDGFEMTMDPSEIQHFRFSKPSRQCIEFRS
jgi:NAD(P)-dependent dehydrogenase (short-subunit alcohol dehydrogenase family)